MSDPWLLRPYEPSDEDGVVYCWLKSFARSSYGKSIGANVEQSDAERAYWAEHRLVVMDVIAHAQTTIACDREAPEVMWGFAVMEPGVVHYALVKRRFDESGDGVNILRALLGDRLRSRQRYTHELADFKRRGIIQGGLMVPSAWVYDPFLLARRAAA